MVAVACSKPKPKAKKVIPKKNLYFLKKNCAQRNFSNPSMEPDLAYSSQLI